MSRFGLVLLWAVGGCEVGGDDSVLPDVAAEARLIDYGGGWPGPCSMGGTSHVYAVGGRQVSWHVCEPPSGKFLDGQATIDGGEARRLTEAIAQVKPSTRQSCVADGNLVSLVIKTAIGRRQYYDESAACGKQRDFVSGIGEVSRAFDEVESAHQAGEPR